MRGRLRGKGKRKIRKKGGRKVLESCMESSVNPGFILSRRYFFVLIPRAERKGVRRTMPVEKQKLDALSVIVGLHKRCSFLGSRLLPRDRFALSRPSWRRLSALVVFVCLGLAAARSA